MEPGQVTVACCQIAPMLGEPKANRIQCEQAIRDAAARGAQVVVLPELVQSGYCFENRAQALACAESADGATLALWAVLAHELNVVIVGGFCERLNDHQVANSAALVDRGGVRAIYRKAHLWDNERFIFEAGAEPPAVVDTHLGRLGVLICYDLEFPEWVRLPALEGVELLCVPTNWPNAPRPSAQQPGEITRVQANASTNRMFIAACDRCGVERGIDWVGGSVMVNADGYLLTDWQPDAKPRTLIARMQIASARIKKIGNHSDVFLDRRPALYARVTR